MGSYIVGKPELDLPGLIMFTTADAGRHRWRHCEFAAQT